MAGPDITKCEISRETAIRLLQIGERRDDLAPDVLWVSGPIEKSLGFAETIGEKLASAHTSRDELMGSTAFLTSSLNRLHTDEGRVSGVLEHIYLFKLAEVERIAEMSLEKAKARRSPDERSAEPGAGRKGRGG